MRTIIVIFALAGALGTCFAQGTVNWNSLSPAAITVQTNASTYYDGRPAFGGAVGNTAPASSGLTYYFELLYNSSFTGSQIASPDYTGLFNGTWRDTGLAATNNNTAGWLNPVNPNSAATVPWAHGVTNNIMLVGWSSNLGADWATASNILANWNTFGSGSVIGIAFFGESATGYLNPGNSNPGNSVFGTSAQPYGLPINSPDMQLYLMPVTLVVPEPTTLALAGLGGLSLACRAIVKRRRAASCQSESEDGFRRRKV